jgi:hypothetical protein
MTDQNGLEGDDSMRRLRMIFVLCTLALPVTLASLASQTVAPPPQVELPVQSMERKIAAAKKSLLDEATDLDEMGKSVTGLDASTVLSIDDKVGQGVAMLDATLWFIGVYERMQCEPDQNLAKIALKNRLEFYSHLLDMLAGQTAGALAYTRLPAVAQAGQRSKDELRTAKSLLDELDTSLK